MAPVQRMQRNQNRFHVVRSFVDIMSVNCFSLCSSLLVPGSYLRSSVISPIAAICIAFVMCFVNYICGWSVSCFLVETIHNLNNNLPTKTSCHQSLVIIIYVNYEYLVARTFCNEFTSLLHNFRSSKNSLNLIKTI